MKNTVTTTAVSALLLLSACGGEPASPANQGATLENESGAVEANMVAENRAPTVASPVAENPAAEPAPEPRAEAPAPAATSKAPATAPKSEPRPAAKAEPKTAPQAEPKTAPKPPAPTPACAPEHRALGHC